jgi:RNA polymerase sigma factor, sigma-70 family
MELSISAYNDTDKLLRGFYAYISEFYGDPLTVYFARSEEGESAADQDVYEAEAEKLLDDYGNSILRLAYSYLHNMSDAEDVLQDTLIQYLKAAPDFENAAHEKNWMMRVAGNISKNRLKYNRVRHSDELSDELTADGREDLSFVWEAVKSLPVMYREVIHLYYYEGYPTAEIAAILKEKDSTVRSHLSRGREKLREILKEAYDFGQ